MLPLPLKPATGFVPTAGFESFADGDFCGIIPRFAGAFPGAAALDSARALVSGFFAEVPGAAAGCEPVAATGAAVALGAPRLAAGDT